MHLTIRERYGLQALAALGSERPGSRLRSQEIAEREGIPRKFLEQVLLSLRNAGLVQSSRGRDGGYVLNQRPEAITVRHAVEALKGPIALLPCFAEEGDRDCPECSRGERCWMSRSLEGANVEIRAALDAITVADLAKNLKAAHESSPGRYMYYI